MCERGNGNKDGSINQLTNNGAADSAEPQLMPTCNVLKQRHDNGVGKATAEVTKDARRNDPAGADAPQHFGRKLVAQHLLAR